MLRLAVTALLATAMTQGVALAQNNDTMSNHHNNATASSQTQQDIPQQLKSQLKDEGYTNIKIVPGSFLVSAKNKNGNPVQMVVGPHSITMLTMQKSGLSSTTGAGSSESSFSSSK